MYCTLLTEGEMEIIRAFREGYKVFVLGNEEMYAEDMEHLMTDIKDVSEHFKASINQ